MSFETSLSLLSQSIDWASDPTEDDRVRDLHEKVFHVSQTNIIAKSILRSFLLLPLFLYAFPVTAITEIEENTWSITQKHKYWSDSIQLARDTTLLGSYIGHFLVFWLIIFVLWMKANRAISTTQTTHESYVSSHVGVVTLVCVLFLAPLALYPGFLVSLGGEIGLTVFRAAMLVTVPLLVYNETISNKRTSKRGVIQLGCIKTEKVEGIPLVPSLAFGYCNIDKKLNGLEQGSDSSDNYDFMKRYGLLEIPTNISIGTKLLLDVEHGRSVFSSFHARVAEKIAVSCAIAAVGIVLLQLSLDLSASTDIITMWNILIYAVVGGMLSLMSFPMHKNIDSIMNILGKSLANNRSVKNHQSGVSNIFNYIFRVHLLSLILVAQLAVLFTMLSCLVYSGTHNMMASVIFQCMQSFLLSGSIVCMVRIASKARAVYGMNCTLSFSVTTIYKLIILAICLHEWSYFESSVKLGHSYIEMALMLLFGSSIVTSFPKVYGICRNEQVLMGRKQKSVINRILKKSYGT